MVTHLAVMSVCLLLTGYAVAAEPATAETKPPAIQADAVKLCERLAGTEREICLSQARENQRMAKPGASPPGTEPPRGAAPAPQPGTR